MAAVQLRPYQAAAIFNPYEHFSFWGGVAIGKSFCGAHFALKCMEARPDLMGLVGANNHDQLSQVSIRELIYWLDEYGYDYEIDSRPPGPKKFKTYKNILSVRTKKNPKIWTHAFTRIMSAPNPLRGIEFAWYWLDETRDTPDNTHDVILSRLREDPHFRRGFITSTPNGEDWSWKRFVQNRRPGQRMYGSMHIPTKDAVGPGMLSQEYYDMLRASYSELMALQELDAQHVNVKGGRAYYSFGPWNELLMAPWGIGIPTRARPLIVGCDFNYAPSPCVWMVGQLGPEMYGPKGEFWGQCIHWFGEISGSEKSTPEMTQMLINQYPGFHYRVFGDSSGKRGTTSNAGRHDYAQIAEVMYDNSCQFTIDADQANPHVKDRVENMCRLARNSMGETRQTYNPYNCPLFHSDVKMVGWKQTQQMGRAKLDNGGNLQLTHATDGGGYAVFKLFPPNYRTFVGGTLDNTLVADTLSAI